MCCFYIVIVFDYTIAFFVDFVEFTDEEGYGKYLDLHEVYDKFLNLRGVEVSLNFLKWQIRNTVFLDLFFYFLQGIILFIFFLTSVAHWLPYLLGIIWQVIWYCQRKKEPRIQKVGWSLSSLTHALTIKQCFLLHCKISTKVM